MNDHRAAPAGFTEPADLVLTFALGVSLYVLPQLLLRRAAQRGWTWQTCSLAGALLGAGYGAVPGIATFLQPGSHTTTDCPIAMIVALFSAPVALFLIPDRTSLVPSIRRGAPIGRWRARVGIALGTLLGSWLAFFMLIRLRHERPRW